MPQVVRDIFENYVKERFDLEDCIAVNNGTSALIAPLWSMDFEPGDEVNQGQVIGRSGNTGWSTGPIKRIPPPHPSSIQNRS